MPDCLSKLINLLTKNKLCFVKIKNSNNTYIADFNSIILIINTLIITKIRRINESRYIIYVKKGKTRMECGLKEIQKIKLKPVLNKCLYPWSALRYVHGNIMSKATFRSFFVFRIHITGGIPHCFYDCI